jgi:glycosyltransferase involved in cell wall biosynthesis
MSVAEAMLAGCVPVTTNAGALPEVAGGCGVRINSTAPAEIAKAVETALTLSSDERLAARDRILKRFPLSARAEQLEELIRPLVNHREV